MSCKFDMAIPVITFYESSTTTKVIQNPFDDLELISDH